MGLRLPSINRTARGQECDGTSASCPGDKRRAWRHSQAGSARDAPRRRARQAFALSQPPCSEAAAQPESGAQTRTSSGEIIGIGDSGSLLRDLKVKRGTGGDIGEGRMKIAYGNAERIDVFGDRGVDGGGISRQQIQ